MSTQNSSYKLIRKKLDKVKINAVNGFQELALAQSNESATCLSTEDVFLYAFKLSSMQNYFN